MSKKLRLFLITALAAVAALCVVSGCKLQNTLDDILSTRNLTAQVTYFTNGGSFDDDDRTPVKTLYFNEGMFPLDIGEPSNSAMTGTMGNTKVPAGRINISRTGYNLVGWFRIEVNEDGVPLYADGSLYDAAEGAVKEFKLSDEQYEFKERLEDGDRVYLCAKWLADVQLIIKLAGEQGLTVTSKDATYNIGDTLRSEHFEASGSITLSTLLPSDDKTAFIAFYSDAECTQLFESTTVTEGEEDTILYAKYIKNHANGKKWSVLKTASDVRGMFNDMMGATNYYLVKDIDCSGISVRKTTTDLVIFGNNFKLSNLSSNGTGLISDSVNSFLGTIAATTEISDLTFENVTSNYSLRNENVAAYIYFVFGAIESGAKISNVKISGTVNVTTNGGTVRNALNDKNNVCFGGFTSDSEYQNITATVEFNIN